MYYQVVGEAENGREVLELTADLNPDIIIMDINMPLLSGLESAVRIKTKYPQTIILLNTAYAEFEFARKAVDYGLDAYLLKPAKEGEIFSAIDTCFMRRGQKMAPSRHAAAITEQQCEINDRSMEIVIRHIDEHFYDPLTLQQLADMVHFSPPYLSRIFHKKQGLTIKAYITGKRLENARYLLKETNLSIGEIAESCGFLNISHFDRIFKQQTDRSPMEYRRRVK